MDLGQLARHHHGPRAEGRFDGLERFQDAVRRLVEDQRGLLFGQRFQQVGPLPRFARQEPAEVEGVGGQPGAGQRGERSRGTGIEQTPLKTVQLVSARRQLDLESAPHVRLGQAHQAIAGVGHQRHAGIGNQRDHGATEQTGEEFFGALRLVVIVIAHCWLVDVVVIQQFARLPRVFARDQIGRAQHADRAIGDVLQVPDGRSHHVEQTGHVLSISGGKWDRRSPFVVCHPPAQHGRPQKAMVRPAMGKCLGGQNP